MSLYEDLGGAPAIDAALSSFYPKVLADPKLSPYFEDVDMDILKKRVAAFFAMATGGPAGYKGPGMREAHARLMPIGLNDEVFDSFVGLFADVLRELGVPDAKVAEVNALLQGARGEVLSR